MTRRDPGYGWSGCYAAVVVGVAVVLAGAWAISRGADALIDWLIT